MRIVKCLAISGSLLILFNPLFFKGIKGELIYPGTAPFEVKWGMAYASESSNWLSFEAVTPLIADNTYYVAPDGSDSNNGTIISPWQTIAHAIKEVPDNHSTIVVKNGIYDECVTITRRFQSSLHLKAENHYQTRWQCNQPLPIVKFAAARNIILEGFEFTRPNLAKNYEWFVILWQNSHSITEGITLKDNIFHDSVNNDLLRVGPGVRHVVIENNIFYNQAGPDEHIDINGAFDVVVRDNIFFNDFAGSGRVNYRSTSSYIVIKDSLGIYGGSQKISIRRNIFLNWEGQRKSFVLVGEDGIGTFEAVDVIIENNLMLGNGPDPMESPIGIRGSKNITVQANTIVGDQSGWYFGLVSYTVKNNRRNENIGIYNNIWSDPTGTMGDAFSCCSPSQTLSYTFDNNLFFNKGNPFPSGNNSFVEVSDDVHRIIGNPKLGNQSKGVIVPRWNGESFNGGYSTINEAFRGLVNRYGALSLSSAALDKANPSYVPYDDILGRDRNKIDSKPDIGAYELQRRGQN